MGVIVDQLVLGRFLAVLGGAWLFLAVLGFLAMQNRSQKSIKMKPGGGNGIQKRHSKLTLNKSKTLWNLFV